MQTKLTVTGGKANKKEVSLNVPVIVGRSRTAGLTIAHPMVSRQHCEIVEAGGLLRIRDLGSTNGTYVCGKKVDEAVLRPHDQFTIGPLTFEVDYEYVGESTIVEERFQNYAADVRATTARPEAEPASGEPTPWATPSPEGGEPSEDLPEAYAEVGEPSAAAESAGEGFDFLDSRTGPAEPPAPVQSADEGFEFLDPSSAPAVPAEPPDEVSAFTEAPVEPSEPLPFESLAPPEPPMEPPLESFESAESAEEFVPAEEPEAPAGLPQVAESLGNEVPRVISPAEPPIEFEEPGPGAGSPEMPGIAPVDGQIPDFDARSNPPGSEVVAPGGLESTSDAESIAPLGFGGPQDEGPVAPPEVPIWGGAPADSESDVQGIPSSGFEVQDLAESSGDLEAQGQEPSALDFESNPWEDSTGETQTASFVPDAPSRKRKAKKGWWPFGKGK